MKKRIFSLILVLCLIIGSAGEAPCGTGVFAAERNSNLGAHDKELYDYMLAFLKSVAAGDQTSTVLKLPCSVVMGVDKNELSAQDLGVSAIMEGNTLTAEAEQAIHKLMDVDLNPIMNAILLDAYADMFWYDKTKGITWGSAGSLSIDPYAVYLPTEGYEIQFFVSADYSKSGATGTTEVNSSKIAAAKKAIVAAQKIVNAAAGKSDYQKLYYYAEQVCALTDYDKTAAGSVYAVYGDPWQFVNVFDGNDSTKVVCEGYSKAFKLLCDLTTFDSPLVECCLISGTMTGGTGAGPHMWNLVTMDDGKVYMADITNCDEGATGQGIRLFLRGCDTGTSSGYSIVIPERKEGNWIYPSATITYNYNDDTKKLYSTAERTIAKSDYAPDEPAVTPEPTAEVTAAPEPTATAAPVPTVTPVPTATATPIPTATAVPTATPAPTATDVPEATLTPVPSITTAPTLTPTATVTPVPTTAAPTATPIPGVTGIPVTATPTPQQITATPTPYEAQPTSSPEDEPTVVENDDGSTTYFYPDGSAKEINIFIDENGRVCTDVTVWTDEGTVRTCSYNDKKGNLIENITEWPADGNITEQIRTYSNAEKKGSFTFTGREIFGNGDMVFIVGSGYEGSGIRSLQKYVFTDDFGLKLVYFKHEGNNVTVPASVNIYDGTDNATICDVTVIGKGAFTEMPKTIKITLPKTVETIEKGAFSGLKKLKTVVLTPTALSTVQKGAFTVTPKKLTVKIKADAALFKKVKKLIKASGLAKGVKLKRVK
ncbi:MAG: leucine-rich repeat protein [Lachnospiraceae bacterium]|nr:leucine-rich repeat protein [Lachnospiraceae bacterium]